MVEAFIRNPLQSYRRRRALHNAIAFAYATFSRQHPEWAASFFDEYFLRHRLVPLLTTIDSGEAQLRPGALARDWVKQLNVAGEERRELIAEATPVASDLLWLLDQELHGRGITSAITRVQSRPSHDSATAYPS